MLFNSYEYIFVFLPLTLFGYFALARRGTSRGAILWLCGASLVFYGWWRAIYLALLVPLTLFNYLLAIAIDRARQDGKPRIQAFWTAGGVAVNLAVLGYFKYATFFVDNVNAVFGASLNLGAVILPIGISFFTFQKIAYLVDVHRGGRPERHLANFSLFVFFFPQLISGPIVHHSEILPQLRRPETFAWNAQRFAVGITWFAIGLFKKTILADGLAQYANPGFNAADAGAHLALLQSWGAALAYTFQLYFDFSGYTDMAIGAARLFGVRLPYNFDSPYKATSIIDFWRRWHMTLSRFLRDYLYIPLGGSRRGPARRYANLLATMVLGGLWHGAAWTFVCWGALHGAYLVANHGWRALRRALGIERESGIGSCLAWGLTFVAVVAGWVLFRAHTFAGALAMLQGMAGLNGVTLPEAYAIALSDFRAVLQAAGVSFTYGGGTEFTSTWLWCLGALALVLALPNTQQILERAQAASEAGAVGIGRWRLRSLTWRPTAPWAIVTAALSLAGILALAEVTEFLYFQF